MTPNWTLVLIFLAIVALGLHLRHARSEEQRYERPQYWPSYEQERRQIDPPRYRSRECPLDGRYAWSCGRPPEPDKKRDNRFSR
jgi:hypothetical protein